MLVIPTLDLKAPKFDNFNLLNYSGNLVHTHCMEFLIVGPPDHPYEWTIHKGPSYSEAYMECIG